MVDEESKSAGNVSFKLPPRTVALLTEELSTLLSAGLDLDRALAIMLDAKSDPRIKGLLGALQRGIHEGADFSTVLAAHPKTFSATYVNLIHAGEISGQLPEIVNRLASHLNMMLALKERVSAALIYPLILVAVAGLSVLMVLIFVLPEFDALFNEMDATLPLLTKVVMNIAGFFQRWWWLGLGALLLILFFFKRRFEDPSGRIQIDALLIRLPLLGMIIREWEAARFARNLYVLTKHGVPVTESVAVAADAVGNRAIAESLHIAGGDLRLGGTLSERLIRDDMLPRQASQMIQVGEESGEMVSMLDNVARLYDRRVGASLERGLALLEPILILTLAAIISVIIFSVLFAILGLNDVPI